LALAKGLLNDASRSVFLFVAVGAYGNEVRIATKKLTGRRNYSSRVLGSAYFQILKIKF